MDEAIRGCTTHTPRKHEQIQCFVDGIELVVRSLGHVGRVRHPPQLAGPRSDGAGATFTLGIEAGQMRVDTTEVTRISTRLQRLQPFVLVESRFGCVACVHADKASDGCDQNCPVAHGLDAGFVSWAPSRR